MLVRYRSEVLSLCASFSSEISPLFIIAVVRSNLAIKTFSRIFGVVRSICEITRIFPIMSRREMQDPHVIGQVMLLSRVTSHELSIVSVPLVPQVRIFDFLLVPETRANKPFFGNLPKSQI